MIDINVAGLANCYITRWFLFISISVTSTIAANQKMTVKVMLNINLTNGLIKLTANITK